MFSSMTLFKHASPSLGLVSTPMRTYVKGGSFRKRLGIYSFKHKKKKVHKNTHAMSIQTRQALRKNGYKGELRIQELERNSTRPFGKWSRKGQFKFNIDMVPFYNVPDLTGFNLKPYVSHFTPQVPEGIKVERQIKVTNQDVRMAHMRRRSEPGFAEVPVLIDPLSDFHNN